MTHLKKLALVAALSLAGITAAHATQVGGSDTPISPVNTFGGGTQWTFSDAAFTLDRTAGQAFIDYFFVNIPDNEYVTFDFSNAAHTRPSVAFTEFDLGYYAGDFIGGESYPYAPGLFTAYSVNTQTFTLGSGYYEFDISGVFTSTGGRFEGDVFGSPIPEPSGWALLLAGLGVTGLLARRRKQQA